MPGDRKTPHAIVGPGVSVGGAGLIVVLAITTRTADATGPGFSTAMSVGGLTVLWFLLRGVRVLSIETLLLAATLFVSDMTLGSEPELAAAMAAVVVVQTLVAVLLLRRWCPDLWGCGGERPLDRPRLLARYGGALAVGMAVGAVLATVAWTTLTGERVELGGALWFGRTLCSSLVVVTFGLLLGERITSEPPRPRLLSSASWLELLAAVAFTLGMYVLAFWFDELPLAFPLLAATVWFGLRFSTLLSATHSMVTGVVTLALTLRDIGPFAATDREDLGYLLAGFYVATIVVTGLGISTGRDEREALAAELRRTREEAEYQASVREAVIGSMNEGLFVLDDGGSVLLHNPAAAEIFGLNEGEMTREALVLRSNRWADGTPMPDAERPSSRALAGETVRDVEILVSPGEDLSDRVVSVSAIPLPRDAARGRARALVLFRDATTEHARREELAAFAGVVAHDLRNPLAAIDGWTEMIADELDTGGLDAQLAREFVSRVRSSSRRMRELIRDLLAHATASARDLDVARVDVTEIAREVAAARHAEKQVTCRAIPAVLADGVLIRQVLDNLIGNALKYVSPGVDPRVIVRGCPHPPGCVTIQVVDNGIGIPRGEEEQIFDEFHRAHYRDYEGSGLGLSIVRRIITRHDGTITARANPDGPGSVFEFTLPAYDVGPDDATE
ncbi:MAG: PAS domain-containing protein [Nocardioidaceae bacterium]|nr:PAS domain-containing protein [Nocardioidaceae bacterium]